MFRKIVAKAILAGVPVPAFANAISYIDGLGTKVVGANLIQAQRDYFGAICINALIEKVLSIINGKNIFDR